MQLASVGRKSASLSARGLSRTRSSPRSSRPGPNAKPDRAERLLGADPDRGRLAGAQVWPLLHKGWHTLPALRWSREQPWCASLHLLPSSSVRAWNHALNYNWQGLSVPHMWRFRNTPHSGAHRAQPGVSAHVLYMRPLSLYVLCAVHAAPLKTINTLVAPGLMLLSSDALPVCTVPICAPAGASTQLTPRPPSQARRRP